MELGMMSGPNLDAPKKHPDWEHYGKLGIRSCQLGMGDDPATIRMCERMMSKGWTPIITMTCRPEELRNKNLFRDLAERCANAARVLPAKHFEIWPEPGCPHVTQGRVSLPAYVDILKVCYEAIKEVDPTKEVWNGGIGQHGTLWAIEPFMEQGLQYTDVLNLHPYLFEVDPQRAADKIANLGGQALAKMRDLGMRKPIVIGEWGYPSAKIQTVHTSFIESRGISSAKEEDQAFIYKQVLEAYEPVADRFIFCYIHDLGGNFWGEHTGLVRTDGSLKPAYHVVAEFAKSRGLSYA